MKNNLRNGFGTYIDSSKNAQSSLWQAGATNLNLSKHVLILPSCEKMYFIKVFKFSANTDGTIAVDFGGWKSEEYLLT